MFFKKNSKSLIEKYWLLILLLVVIFLVGYFLRAYNSIYHDLPLSPYEAFEVNYGQDDLGRAHFTNQLEKYPTKIIVGQLFNKIFGDFYILFLLGFIAIFFLGKELTNNKWGGVLAASLFAISPENLLHYTKTIIINDSGLCYVAIFFSILFFTKFIKSKENIYQLLFVFFSLIALTSYHTGAVAMIVLLIGLGISLFYSNKLDKKIFFSLGFIFLFYAGFLFLTDNYQIVKGESKISQLNLIKNVLVDSNPVFFLSLAFVILLVTWGIIRLNKKNPKLLQSGYIPLLGTIIAAILIFSKINFFGFLLKLGVGSYYISTITLNNIFAQIILTHVYLLTLVPILFQKKLDINSIIKRGWLLGLLIISFGLISTHYFSRIPDYSFPLMFVLFASYWMTKERFKKIVIIITFLLLAVSQLVIFNDPFSMRRYYNQEEIISAQKIIDLNLEGKIVSDFRTSALFRYLGKTDIIFFATDNYYHQIAFYSEEKMDAPGMVEIYFIVSESMRHIVYAANFQTRPLGDKQFTFYENNFEKIYDDGLMKVYKRPSYPINL